MSHAPASRCTVQVLPQPQQHEVGSSAVVLQPCNRTDVVVPQAQQLTPHAAAGGHAASGRGKYWEDSYQTALRTRYASLHSRFSFGELGTDVARHLVPACGGT